MNLLSSKSCLKAHFFVFIKFHLDCQTFIESNSILHSQLKGSIRFSLCQGGCQFFPNIELNIKTPHMKVPSQSKKIFTVDQGSLNVTRMNSPGTSRNVIKINEHLKTVHYFIILMMENLKITYVQRRLTQKKEPVLTENTKSSS